MNDKVKQAIFVRAALLEVEAAGQALPPGPERRALIAAQRRLHARLHGCLILAEDVVPGITAEVFASDSGGGDKQVSFAEGIGTPDKQAA